MKKIVFAGLLIFLCITMTACTATDPDNLFEIEPDNTVASTPENNEDTTASVPEDTQFDVEDIMYNNAMNLIEGAKKDIYGE